MTSDFSVKCISNTSPPEGAYFPFIPRCRFITWPYFFLFSPFLVFPFPILWALMSYFLTRRSSIQPSDAIDPALQ